MLDLDSILATDAALSVSEQESSFAQALCAGLTARPRLISPQWFYDLRGSQLFERICLLPEYYPTRVETALLHAHAEEFAELMGPEVEIVEFGAGAAIKVRILLQALAQAGLPARAYCPMDVSAEFMQQAAAAVRTSFPGLRVQPLVADLNQELRLVAPPPGSRRLGFYPGSSIGNFNPPEAIELLGRMRRALHGGALLIGVDLVKEPARLHAAYNDAAGVTAAFNLNLWARANREAGANFELSAWAHGAFYNPPLHRVEMHLVSRRAQTVHVGNASFSFVEGDSVHTESSYKYTVDSFRQLAQAAGWKPRQVWCDEARDFSLHWLDAA